MKIDDLWERLVQAERRAAAAEAELAQMRAERDARLDKQRARKARFLSKNVPERSKTIENVPERSEAFPGVQAPPSVSLSPHTPINPSTPPSSANAEPTSAKAASRRGVSQPWMGDIRSLWHRVFPGNDPPKGAANMLAPLVTRNGIEPVLVELEAYLRGTPAKFLNLAKFAATYGEWAQKGPSGAARANGKGVAAAHRLFEIIRDHGLAAQVPIEDHDRTIDDLAARGEIRDAAAVKAALRTVKPWTWFRSLRSGDESKAVERIAQALADGPPTSAIMPAAVTPTTSAAA